MKIIDQFMAGLHTGEPMDFNRLKIMPILVAEDRTLPFVDLEEALKKGFIVINEVSEGGSVPNLEVSNTSAEDVIILDGEELIGAKQNRIVNTTIVVPATTKPDYSCLVCGAAPLALHVSQFCVEQIDGLCQPPSYETRARDREPESARQLRH